MKYDFKELSMILKKSIGTLKFYYDFKGGKELFEFGIRNHHRVCLLDEKNLEKFKKILERTHAKITNNEWTESALECYENNMICKKCNQYDIACMNAPTINGLKPMKMKVLELIKKYGVPK